MSTNSHSVAYDKSLNVPECNSRNALKPFTFCAFMSQFGINNLWLCSQFGIASALVLATSVFLFAQIVRTFVFTGSDGDGALRQSPPAAVTGALSPVTATPDPQRVTSPVGAAAPPRRHPPSTSAAGDFFHRQQDGAAIHDR